MSDLERILKLASHGTENAQSQAPAERELKDVPVVEEPTTTREAVGEFAEPIYDLIDMHFEGDCQPVFDDLVRFLSGDQIKEFVDDFRRHHELPMGDEETEESVEPTEPSTEEGNEFSGALAQAKKDGKKEFEVDGKKYKVEESEPMGDYTDKEFACININTGEYGYCDKDELHKYTHYVPAEEFTYFDAENEDMDFADFDDEMADQEGWMKIPSNEVSEESNTEEDTAEEISEAPTMDTTQLITLLKNAGLSEEKINEKINEWANTPAGAAEEEATSHGEPYENFAQSVNLSLKRYLDAEDMKVGLKEHKVEDIKEAYKKSKGE